MPRYVMRRAFWDAYDGEPHRCSIPHCSQPAVVFYSSTVGGWGGRRAHERRRFLCRFHAETAYRMVQRASGWWFRYSQSWPLRKRKTP